MTNIIMRDMLKRTIIALLMITVLGFGAFAATSATYAISSEVIDLGGASMESTTYNMISKLREIEPKNTTGSSYTLESRFLGMVYGISSYSTFEIPVLSSITPNAGYNDKAYTVIINGTNISYDATAKLYKAGETDIVGTFVTIDATGTSMEATFDLTNTNPGIRNLFVRNVGLNGVGTLSNAFTISSQGALRIVGVPFNDPNPFDPSSSDTHIKYKLSMPAGISLYMFNQKGELIWQRVFSSGSNGGAIDNDIIWNGITDFEEQVPTGVYVLRIVARTGGTSKELGRIKVAVLRSRQ